jgi:hypothetical protein
LAESAGAALARAVDFGFRKEAEIHSPSKKMQRNTDMMVRPVVDGLKDGAGDVFDAMQVMVAPAVRAPSANASPAGATSGASGVRDVHLTVRIEVGSERAARQLEGPTFQMQLKKTLADVLLQAGFGVPS